LPLRDASVDLVTCAQAFHWFDAGPALDELARVLRPGGRLALMWNMRDDRVPWVADLSAVMNSVGPKPYNVEADYSGLLRGHPAFEIADHQFEWADDLDPTRLVELVTSRSYVAALPPPDREPVLAAVRELVSSFGPTFELPYLTDLIWCRRR
jgi:SAM-dependent methyltransferase